MNGMREEPVEAHDLVRDRLDDLLLALAAGEVALGRVQLVLADARVDEGAAAVQLLLALPEAPALASCCAPRRRLSGHSNCERIGFFTLTVTPPIASTTSPNEAEVDEHDVVDGRPVRFWTVSIASAGPPSA